MNHLKRLGIVSALAMTMVGSGGPAQATQLTPTGAQVAFHSFNATFNVHGGLFIRCNSTITGRLPATVATSINIPITLEYNNCTSVGGIGAPVETSAACHGASSPILHVMGIGGNQATGVVTLPSGCNLSVTIPNFGCTLTVNGPQTIGNGTTGIGGGVMTGGASPTIHLNQALVRDVVGDGPTSSTCVFATQTVADSPCPPTTAIPTMTTTGTLTGTYTSGSTIDVDGA